MLNSVIPKISIFLPETTNFIKILDKERNGLGPKTAEFDSEKDQYRKTEDTDTKTSCGKEKSKKGKICMMYYYVLLQIVVVVVVGICTGN